MGACDIHRKDEEGMSTLAQAEAGKQRAGGPRPSSSRRARWQIAGITLGAALLYVGIRQLPTGTNLSHVDFRVAGETSIEFCDPANPQFIPVVAVPSPVSLNLQAHGGAIRIGQPVHVTASLGTSTGKVIGPQDLLVTHTEKLHLLIFDPGARHYQHLHPTPGARDGDWDFDFTPVSGGTYRVFADFTPTATARGLYASADLEVPASDAPAASGVQEGVLPPANVEQVEPRMNLTEIGQGEYVYRLVPGATPIRAGLISEFAFTARRKDGRPATLEPVMDAYAHLVAVDEARSGFAHLHPAEIVAVSASGSSAAYSKFTFKVKIPRAGRYVIWAQVKIEGREHFVPFWFDVV